MDNQPIIKIAPPNGEAGASLNVEVLDADGIRTQLTLRAESASDWLALLRERKAFIEAARKNGWIITRTTAPASAPTPPSTPAPALESPNGSPAATPVADFDTAGLYCTEVGRVVCRPEPGDKVTIEFFEDGHKWADFKVGKAPLARAGGLMKHVAHLVDITRAVEVTARINVWWKYGKEYVKDDGTTGKYKDVMHVRAAA